MDVRFPLAMVACAVAVGSIAVPAGAAGPDAAGGAVSISPDGGLLAAGGESGDVVVVDLAAGRTVWEAAGGGAPVTALDFSPDGSRLASAARDSVIRLWDSTTGELQDVVSGHASAVTDLDFSPDGGRILSGGEDGRVILWDVATDAMGEILVTSGPAVTAVAFSPTADMLATATAAGTITIWDANELTRLRDLPAHAGAVRALAFSPDGQMLASTDASTVAVTTGAAAPAVLVEAEGLADVSFSPVGGPLAVAQADGDVLLVSPDTGEVEATRSSGVSGAGDLEFTPDGGAVAIAGGTSAGVTDVATGTSLLSIDLPAAAEPAAAPPLAAPSFDWSGSGGPILVATCAADPYSAFYTEILRAEGLTAFSTLDVTQLTGEALAPFVVVLLASCGLDAERLAALTTWVEGGGNLIAARPDAALQQLLGITAAGGQLRDGYLRIDTSTTPGNGITGQTIQFHGSADLYSLAGARAVATLYSSATTQTPSPAVTLRAIGPAGGQAAAFTYDLARSIALTRQGNPAWAGEEHDGYSPIRSNDMFMALPGATDWVDLNKVGIPQADEQQRLLVNLIVTMAADRLPLPRFWYLPEGLKAAVLMTGDDHGWAGTKSRFEEFLAASPPGCSVDGWDCIRGTSYLIVRDQLTDAEAARYESLGFEIGLHPDTGCWQWTPDSLRTAYSTQLAAFAQRFPSLPAPRTVRTHCVAWSDWSTQPVVELEHGIRLDTNYYMYPADWVQDEPGFMTGSGMPMRFTDSSGALIDVYQAATQMTDESGQTYPYTVETLLDRALGSLGYYGVFTVNAHTDADAVPEATTVVAAAKERGVPVVTAEQVLTWVDGRNASTFSGFAWDGTTLSTKVVPGPGANGLTALFPARAGTRAVSSVTRDGTPVSFRTETIKGIGYIVVPVQAGTYAVTYASASSAPIVTSTTPAAGASTVSRWDPIRATFNEAMDPGSITGTTFQLRDSAGTLVPASVSYDAATRTAVLAPTVVLAGSATYTARVAGADAPASVRDLSGEPLAASVGWSFTTAAAHDPIGTIDSATAGLGTITLTGWAIDPDTTAPVYLWVTVDGVGRYVYANVSRPDVGAVFPVFGSLHGYATTIAASPGPHQVCATVSNVGAGTHTGLGCRSVTVPGGSPFGNWEDVQTAVGSVRITGWALDPDVAAPVYLWVTVDQTGRYVYANVNRPDVAAVYPLYGASHGFSASIAAEPGTRRVCITASNIGAGSHASLGCRTVVVPGGSPVGNFEGMGAAPGGVSIAGWALDPDTSSPIYLWVTVDGVGRYLLANLPRPDLAPWFPDLGIEHGFAATIPTAPGVHTVCITAANVLYGSHTFLGCRTSSSG